MKTTSIDCDCCGELLRGKKGITFVDKAHLAIKVSFTEQMVDEYGQPDHHFITEDPDRIHHFCNFQCLKQFADYRRKRYESIKQRQRRESARQETN